MRYIIAAVLSFLFLAGDGGTVFSPAFAAEKTCIIASRAEFFDSVSTLKPTMYRASQKALAALLAKINAPRKAAGSFLLEADELYLGVFTTKQGTIMAGIVMFKDGCIVPGTVTSMSIEQWAAFMEAVGLKRDDFEQIKEALS